MISHAAILGLLVSLSCAPPPDAASGESTETVPATRQAQPEEDERLLWWRDAKFGMFIHWGLYAIPAGTWEGKVYPGAAEWLMDSAKIPPEAYAPLAARFNPRGFNAQEWAAIARDAGMRYVVITTKHHDGFCLFDSKHTAYDVMDATPFKRDVMAELSQAVRDVDLRMGWYHSIMDWSHPHANARDFDKYRPVLEAQVTELLTKYGPIGVMWFDGEWINQWTPPMGREMYDLCRRLQPEVIVNNRVGKGRQGMGGFNASGDHPGDFATPEQESPSGPRLDVPWETCLTFNGSWGYHATDTNWKSTDELLRTLVSVCAGGGNLLLNVGPDANGRIPQPCVDRLAEIGMWLRDNADAIYASRGTPFRRHPWGRITQKGQTIFLHVFELPEDRKIRVTGLQTPIAAAAMLLEPDTPLKVTPSEDGPTIVLPKAPVGRHVWVVRVELDGELKVAPHRVSPQADGVLRLVPGDAEVAGPNLRIETIRGVENLGYWLSKDDRASWPIRARKGGTWRVTVDYACAPASGGSRAALVVDDPREGSETSWTVESTGAWANFTTVDIGTVRIPAGEAVTLRVVAREVRGEALINIRSITLTPVN